MKKEYDVNIKAKNYRSVVKAKADRENLVELFLCLLSAIAQVAPFAYENCTDEELQKILSDGFDMKIKSFRKLGCYENLPHNVYINID